MSWMHNNVWIFSIPIMVIMKIEYTIPDETSLLEFALFIKFIISHKRRQTNRTYIYIYDSFSLLLGVQSAPEVGSHKLRNTLYNK